MLLVLAKVADQIQKDEPSAHGFQLLHVFALPIVDINCNLEHGSDVLKLFHFVFFGCTGLGFLLRSISLGFE